jgi:hypothetical protein
MNGIRLHDYGPDYSTMNPNFPALRRIMAGLFVSAFLCLGVTVFLMTKHHQAPMMAHRLVRACRCNSGCMRRMAVMP